MSGSDKICNDIKDAQRKEYCEYLLAQCQTDDPKSVVKAHDNTTRSVASKYCPVQAKFWALSDNLPKTWALQRPEQSARVAPAQNQPSSQAVEVKRDGSRNIFEGGEFIISGEGKNAVCAIKIEHDNIETEHLSMESIDIAREGSGSACDMMLASYQVLRGASDELRGVIISAINELDRLKNTEVKNKTASYCYRTGGDLSYQFDVRESCVKAENEVTKVSRAEAEYYDVVKDETGKLRQLKSLKSTNYNDTKRYILARETAKQKFNVSYELFDQAIINTTKKPISELSSAKRASMAEALIDAIEKEIQKQQK